MHTLIPPLGARKKKFRIGRGLGSGRGKTAGRGTKGQRARTGGRKRLGLKGMKQMLLSFPKSRGFHSRHQKTFVIPVGKLSVLKTGATVDQAACVRARLATHKAQRIKIVGGGTLGKPVHVKGLAVSAGAKAVIEKAGGSAS